MSEMPFEAIYSAGPEALYQSLYETHPMVRLLASSPQGDVPQMLVTSYMAIDAKSVPVIIWFIVMSKEEKAYPVKLDRSTVESLRHSLLLCMAEMDQKTLPCTGMIN
jgi:hypothetical protein